MENFSIVIIARNEEVTLPRLLTSLQGATEIVVLDTGSTDSTIEIAESYGALVYTDYTWNNDFGAARNKAAEKASNEWILYLSADEYLPEGEIGRIISLGNTDAEAISCIVEDHTGHVHRQPRLYKKGIQFIDKVHEYLPVRFVTESDITIIHEAGPNHHRDKDLDMTILLGEEKDSRTCYYLAREYFYRGLWIESAYWFEQNIEKSTWLQEKSDVYLYLARNYWSLANGDKARDNCVKAILLNPDFKEALDFMGEITWPEQGIIWKKFADIADNTNVLFIRKGKTC